MKDFLAWAADLERDDRAWLMIGKGPTFAHRSELDIESYRTVGLNHVLVEQWVDVAHAIDIDVIGDCAEVLESQCQWLLMPWEPHLHSQPGGRTLPEWFDEYPVLRRLDDQDRLVWYHLTGGGAPAPSPLIGSKGFSSEAVVQILARLGATTIHTLGVDGGRTYAPTFAGQERTGLLANGAQSFDVQFERLDILADEHGLTIEPLVPPVRIFIGTEDSQVVAHWVLEYSIRKSASVPVEITHMLNLPHPRPKRPENKPRTTFSYARFMIPELCGYQGRAIYMDADMLALGDVAELAALPLDGAQVLASTPPRPGLWDRFDTDNHLGDRSSAVLVLDCGALDWKIDQIIDDLDAGAYTYAELQQLDVVTPIVADRVPVRWNDLERYTPDETRLVHFTVVPTQPWKNDDNPLDDLWMAWYREAVEAGAVPPEDVEAAIAAGHVKESLRAALRLAPSRRGVLAGAERGRAAERQRVAQLEHRLAEIERSAAYRLSQQLVRLGARPRALVQQLRSRIRSR